MKFASHSKEVIREKKKQQGKLKTILDRYEYCIVSQHVRQRTVSPTHYNVEYYHIVLNDDLSLNLTICKYLYIKSTKKK